MCGEYTQHTLNVRRRHTA